jgi:hypothetical protein
MFNRYKVFAAYLFAIPLALMLGFLSASPDELSFMLIGILLFLLALPLLITWHHALLIIFWNSAFNAFFLPGQPYFWLVIAALSFGISFLNHVMGRRPFLSVPEMTRPLLLMAALVVATAMYRGGIGIKALGGATQGGRYYVYILGAIVGYFALTAAQIPIGKGRRMTGLFFLSGTTYVLSNIAYALGPGFYFLYYLVPSAFAMDQAANDYGIASSDRIQGLGPACTSVLCFLLTRYGVRGLFNMARPWRFVLLCITIGASFFAGFRSLTVLLFLIFAIQFYLEGLLRTRLFPVLVGLFVVTFGLILAFASKMPLAVQRAVSFLPVNVDSGIRSEAMGSSEWRFQMWAVVIKDVPKYLIIGKGYGMDPAEMDLTRQGMAMGLLDSFEESILAEDYHNGPLSIIIPFGIAGVVLFVWILIAGYRVLSSNYRYGDERLRQVNRVLLSYYLAYVVSFFFIFGAFNSQLFIFLGAVGLSVSLNGGVVRKPKALAVRDRSSVAQPYAIEVK